MSSDMRTALLDALGRYDVPPGPERVNFTFAFAAGWNAAANPEERSAVPSSHVSETDGLAELDWNRLGSGSYRALDPQHQWAFDKLRAAEGESILREALARATWLLEDWTNDFADCLEGGEANELVTFSRAAVEAARSAMARSK